jgi:hypothetical protein
VTGCFPVCRSPILKKEKKQMTDETKEKRTRVTSDYYLCVFCDGGVCGKCQDEDSEDGRIIMENSGVVHTFKKKGELQRALSQMGAQPSDENPEIFILDCKCEAMVIHGKPMKIETRRITSLV